MKQTNVRFLIDSYLQMARITADDGKRDFYLAQVEELLQIIEDGFQPMYDTAFSKKENCEEDIKSAISISGGCISCAELDNEMLSKYSKSTIRRAKELLVSKGYKYIQSGSAKSGTRRWYMVAPSEL